MIYMKTIFYTLAEFTEENINEQTNKILETITENWNKTTDKGKSLSPNFYKTETEKIKNYAKAKENINFDLFLNSIALAALIGKEHLECTNTDKIFRLLVKMSVSKGISISQHKSGKTL